MRRFSDRAGRAWDVVVGRESWGALLALFVPADGGTVRQAMLAAAGYTEANQELEAMSDAELQALLDGSVEKES
jgi:hypothetical protein